jgi:membrane-associated protease RseP (regulator of RpoE activity)
MAIARGLSALALLLVAASIAAASPCEEARPETGLAVVPRAGALVIAAVDAGSAAAQAGLREGDALAQVNATIPRTCADFARAVREARKERKALLVLVQRGDAAVPLAVAASTWKEPAGTTVATAAERRAAAGPPAPPPPPPPLPPEVPVSLDGVMAGLKALTPADEPSSTLTAYRADLTRVAREIETLAARNAAPPETVERLRGVAHTVEAAAIAWDAMEALREREHRPRRIPIPESAAAPYFEDSPAAGVIDEFAFLRPTVSREPSSRFGVGESSGLWRPVTARALLWERGRADLARVTGEPHAGTP